MTAYELQLMANARGRSSTTLAWMTAAFHRSKKLDGLEKILQPYDDFKLGGIAAKRQEFDGIFQMMSMMSMSEEPDNGD